MNRKTTYANRAVLLAAVLSAGALEAGAAEYGLGVSYHDSVTVLVPIRTDSLLVEPELFLSNQSSSSSSFKTFGVGSGAYVRRNLGPLFESYLGGRLLLVSSKSRSSTSDSKTNSYVLAPTVGIQHYFSKQFSLGLDASLEYRNGKQTSAGNPDQSFHMTGTVTRILLRAYF